LSIRKEDAVTENRTWVRIVLALLAIDELFIGIWALVDPQGFYNGFPGLGRHWVSVDGPYNHHLLIDAGAGFFAVGVALLIAVLWMRREVIQAGLAVLVAHELPHFLYHLTHPLAALGSADKMLSTGGLAIVSLVGIVMLVVVSRRTS
jgi:hypothetical protein